MFVGLPGGTFDMGSPDEEANRKRNEGPVHKVMLSPFLIAKYEVSQAEWKRVMRDNPSDCKGDTYPVERVSWEDCQEFCKKTGLSLQTEAQWEYACRAGKDRRVAGTDHGRAIHPVGDKRPNDFGLHEMLGNVAEWCRDWYQEDFYQESTGTRDPWCENSGSGYRVYRGGSWLHRPRVCRSASRFGVPPSSRTWIGFRPAW